MSLYSKEKRRRLRLHEKRMRNWKRESLMKWKRKLLVKGKLRNREGFLFLPKTINGETRWLCHAKWKQNVVEIYEYDGVCGPMPYLAWQDWRWL